jgi:hypothetical protein
VFPTVSRMLAYLRPIDDSSIRKRSFPQSTLVGILSRARQILYGFSVELRLRASHFQRGCANAKGWRNIASNKQKFSLREGKCPFDQSSK